MGSKCEAKEYFYDIAINTIIVLYFYYDIFYYYDISAKL